MEITITGIHPAAFRRINADSILIALGNKDQSDAEIKRVEKWVEGQKKNARNRGGWAFLGVDKKASEHAV